MRLARDQQLVLGAVIEAIIVGAFVGVLFWQMGGGTLADLHKLTERFFWPDSVNDVSIARRSLCYLVGSVSSTLLNYTLRES